MKRTALLAIIWLVLRPIPARAQEALLLPENVVAALAGELSGERAKDTVEFLTRLHRMRGSRGFRAAAEHVAEKARSYGLEGVEIWRFPADGKTFYGTQKARPAWDAEFAELWELRQSAAAGGRWLPAVRLASWEEMPITLAQDSESAELTTELVDCGAGTAEANYAGKDVRGKICLVSAQPGAAMRLAVEKYGAAGIVSYAQNQQTAWWGEDENLVRWGHLDSFTPTKTFAFMVSLKRGREFSQRLARGETIRLAATVRAGRRPGFYEIATATIPGADPSLRNEEIIFSCHLDHQRPGANDNASGCAAILEVARALHWLIGEGRIPRPARTLRFVWPPEIEGTLALLNGKPDLVPRLKAAIHMDMVGGGPETKAIFHVTRGPASLPSFVHDVAEAFALFVNEQSEQFAKSGRARYPFVAPQGGKEPLRAELADFSMGSDHQVYTDSSFAIPAIYLNDWPDRYIHTNFDSAANIDPTKLLRAAFIGAASGYYLATLTQPSESLRGAMEAAALLRGLKARRRSAGLQGAEASLVSRMEIWYTSEVRKSLGRFVSGAVPESEAEFVAPTVAAGDGALVFRRNPAIKGPMSVFGYDYFEDHCSARRVCRARLLTYQGRWGSGSEYAYEVLNLADGKRTAREISDAVSGQYGPLPLELVVEYLRALETIGVVQQPRR